MRQQRWMKFLKDYDFDLQYHPGEANMAARALIRKTLLMSAITVNELQLIEDFRNLSLNIGFSTGKVHLCLTLVHEMSKNL